MSAPAPAASRILAQTRFETVSLLGNGEQLLVSLILPLLALVGLNAAPAPSLGDGRRIDLVVPGVLAMCVISAAFTATAIATGFDRRYNVLRYLGTTPLGREGLLAAKVLATLAVEVIQVLVIGAVGFALGWRPQLGGLPYAVLYVILGTWVFVALALLLAGVLRAEGVLAVANLLWVIFVGVGGVLVPRTQFHDLAATVVGVLPSSALADGIRAAFTGPSWSAGPVLVLVVWGLVATALAGRTFRWGE